MKRRAIALVGLLLAGCTAIDLQDCPDGSVLGNDVTRIRSSHLRMEIADTASAAARVAPYAIMSAIAYRDGPKCEAGQGVADDVLADLEKRLAASEPEGQRWSRVPELELAGGCEDDTGLLFHVWQRARGGRTDVLLAFRGTSGQGDWLYGNLWWFSRFFIADNQYTRARSHAAGVIAHFEARGGNPRFLATGHSLGGGLAQHVLYAHPRKVVQAIVFDPSSVTGFADLDDDSELEGCACREELGPEARMLRVYESYEILSDLRIFHKIFFPPHRHIQELRFAFEDAANPVAQHSMVKLATSLSTAAQGKPAAGYSSPWFANRDRQCTDRFVDLQARSCKRQATAGWGACPQ